MAGRKPIPTQLKIARGNPGKRPINLAEPKFSSASGEPPEWLGDYAKAVWFRVMAELANKNMAQSVDEGALAAYCQANDQLREATQIIKTEGVMLENADGVKVRHPASVVANEARNAIRTLASEFGFTPSARVKLKAPEPVSDDPFDAFVKRKA